MLETRDVDISTYIPGWAPDRSTMGTIENSAILTVALILKEPSIRRMAQLDLRAIFKKLREEHSNGVSRTD